MVLKAPDWQGMANREARKAVRQAYKTGGTVGYPLARLLELKISLKVLRAVYRGK
jgi:hypothetical protein